VLNEITKLSSLENILYYRGFFKDSQNNWNDTFGTWGLIFSSRGVFADLALRNPRCHTQFAKTVRGTIFLLREKDDCARFRESLSFGRWIYFSIEISQNVKASN
jgi:hypothetical protein